MFVDEVEISIKAGHGGDGLASFRREKYVPKGGPDGGDGGRGGDVYLIADNNLDTLSFYKSNKKFKAVDGERGKNKNKQGKNGENLYLKIPLGTIVSEIKDDKRYKIIELLEQNQKYLISRGGIGGLGNIHFKSPTNQAPREFTHGQKGERKRIFLELRLIADVGLIGLPNAGKSSLISIISNAKPKIACYPFTTINPNLGCIAYHNNNYIVADIPGLIRGASKGKGLGDKFLRHIKRTNLLVHIIDANQPNPTADYQIIRNELKLYSCSLLKKKEIIIFNKSDLIDSTSLNQKADLFYKKIGKKPLIISTKTKYNIQKLLLVINQVLKNC